MSQYISNHEVLEAKDRMINEDFSSASFNNVTGMGNVAYPSSHASNTNFYDASKRGSGDNFPTLLPLSIEIAAKTIAFDLINVIPMASSTGTLVYVDYEYTGGRLDNAEKPFVIQIDVDEINSTDYAVGTVYWGVSNVDSSGNVVDAAKGLKMKYVGKSRINGEPIFRILGSYTIGVDSSNVITVTETTTITVADVFDGAAAISVDDTAKPKYALGTAANGNDDVTASATLVKAIEDHIEGYTGAGSYDTSDWMANGGSTGPMARGTGETSYFRPLGMTTYTKSVEAKSAQVSMSLTIEQVQDLNRSFGYDAVSKTEEVLVNELSQSINNHILDRAFKLGWSNHANVKKVYDTDINLCLDVSAGSATSVTYPGMLDTDVAISMPKWQSFGNYENQSSIQRRIKSRLLAAGNIIAQRGRRGPANFIVVNTQVASALQDNAQYSLNPMDNTINQQNGSLHPVGSIAGMTIYVDPYMSFTDNRVLVGRKGADEEPGLKFMPYIMAETISTIAEGTMAPKVAIKSRYALTEAGQYPETQYLVFDIKTATGGLLI